MKMAVASTNKTKQIWLFGKTAKADKSLTKLNNVKRVKVHTKGWSRVVTPDVDPLSRMLCTKKMAFYLVYTIVTLGVRFLPSNLIILTGTEAVASLAEVAAGPGASRRSGDHSKWWTAMNAFSALLASQVGSPRAAFWGLDPWAGLVPLGQGLCVSLSFASPRKPNSKWFKAIKTMYSVI